VVGTLTPDERAKETEKMLSDELRAMARLIESMLPENWGFGLAIFPFGNNVDEPLIWISNAPRADMVKAMAEFVRRNGGA
jgi:hypothetical protein